MLSTLWNNGLILLLFFHICKNCKIINLPDFFLLNLSSFSLFSFFSHSIISDSVDQWTAACQASLSYTISPSLLKLVSIELVMSSNHLTLCCCLLLLLSIFPSIRVLSNESALCIRWPMYWSFSFSISPSNEYSGLISFRIDWLDLPAVQGTLKSLLQHHSSKTSFPHSFYISQLFMLMNEALMDT